MTAARLRIAGSALAVCVLVAPTVFGRQATYAIDSGQSTLEISVGKTGLFGAFGHSHVIRASRMSGQVDFDAGAASRAAVTFTVDAASLRVLDPGESDEDRQHVQQIMLGASVLDVARFPEITFKSTGITTATAAADGWTLAVAGVLRLHGVERPISVPVQVREAGGLLRARAEVTLRQTDYGMTPVTAVGGTVRVKNEVKITFAIVAAVR